MHYELEDTRRVLTDATMDAATTRTLVTEFIEGSTADTLESPEFYSDLLRAFMNDGNLVHLRAPRGLVDDVVALVDDRRDPAGQYETHRNWESNKYLEDPPEGDKVKVTALSEHGLFHRLREKVFKTP